MAEDPHHQTTSNWVIDRLWRAMVWTALRIPARWRIPLVGWVFANIGGPLSGRQRIADRNLAMVFPDMTAEERRRIAKAVLNNVGRMTIENYDPANMLSRATKWVPEGPGWAAVEQAKAQGRAILFISGHYGNYGAARATLNGRGYDIGALFRPLNNPYLNDHYISTISDVGGGAFPRDRRGLAALLKHLKSGAQVAILTDQYVYDGELLDFLGHPAPTAIAPAEMALRLDALVIPVYSTRLENGLDFRLEFEAPIPHSDAKSMMQALNDSLAAKVRETPEQWFWIHNRWKPERLKAWRRDRAAREPRA